jgi:hypothetical protein
MQRRDTDHSVRDASRRRRSDDEVAVLIDRIKSLLAEQRRREDGQESARSEAKQREIDRLRERLANAVKRQLGS